jgi:hypothetical protein
MSIVKIYKISKQALPEAKKILEAEEKEEEVEGERKIIINEFARTGYTMRDSKVMGFEEGYNYLYIKADEDFFEKNADKVKIEGVEELSGEEYEKVKASFEKEEASEAEGMGAVFKDF